MSHKTSTLNLVIDAALKLDAKTPEWRNAIAFIRSCYAGRVAEYDLDAAVASLSRLTDEEQHALIVWVLLVEEVSGSRA
jgi:hypothetical protein